MSKELKFFEVNESYDRIVPPGTNWGTDWTPSTTYPSWRRIPFTTSGSIVTVDQGSAGYQREGRKILITSIELFLKVEPDAGNTTDRVVFRFICYLDKQCNGTEATLNQLFNIDTVITGNAGAQTLSNTQIRGVGGFKNLYNEERFEILYDETWISDANIYNSTNGNYLFIGKVIRKKMKCKLPIFYNDLNGQGVIANIKSNNIGCFLIADTKGGAAGTGAPPAEAVPVAYSFSSQIRYYDD